MSVEEVTLVIVGFASVGVVVLVLLFAKAVSILIEPKG